jgi:hypothetical protein
MRRPIYVFPSGHAKRSRRLRRLECGADFVQHLILGALRRNQVLDRTPHTDQSNWCLLDRHTVPVSTALCSKDKPNSGKRKNDSKISNGSGKFIFVEPVSGLPV